MHRNNFKGLMITGLSRDVNLYRKQARKPARCKEKHDCFDKSVLSKRTEQAASTGSASDWY
jgi:hypothetical protein